MVHDPVFRTIRTGGEARMTNTISFLGGVLVEDAAFVVLLPVAWVHGIGADELELSETVVPVVAAGGGVDDEFLAGLGVGELLRAFV